MNYCIERLGFRSCCERIWQPLKALGGAVRYSHVYAPRRTKHRKYHRGVVPVRTGGSTSASTLERGQFGLRMKGVGLRMTAKQLQTAETVIKRLIKVVPGSKCLPRFATHLPVCTKGNEVRMGKGKGSFDYWACRIPTGRMIFEIIGEGLHEAVAREALRQAAYKLPGEQEIVLRGALPRVGLHQAIPEDVQKLQQKLKDVHIS